MKEDEEKKRKEREEKVSKMRHKESEIEALIERTVALARRTQVLPPVGIASIAKKHDIFMVRSIGTIWWGHVPPLFASILIIFNWPLFRCCYHGYIRPKYLDTKH